MLFRWCYIWIHNICKIKIILKYNGDQLRLAEKKWLLYLLILTQIRFFSALNHRASLITNDHRKSSFHLQRLSISMQHFNVVWFIRKLDPKKTEQQCWAMTLTPIMLKSARRCMLLAQQSSNVPRPPSSLLWLNFFARSVRTLMSSTFYLHFWQ